MKNSPRNDERPPRVIKIIVPLLLILAAGMYWAMRPAAGLEGPFPEGQSEPEAGEAMSQPGDYAAGEVSSPDATPADLLIRDPLDEEIRKGTLALALERLRQALLGGGGDNWEEVDAASQFLAALAGEDAETLRQVLESFEAEADPALLFALARVIGPHLSAEDGELLGRVLALAEQSEEPEKRAAAVSMLYTVTGVTSELAETVFRLSREDDSVDVRLHAIYAIGHWVANNQGASKDFSRELIKTIDASDDRIVRGTAIQTIALQAGIHEPDILAAMDEYLVHDPASQNRAIAALALGGVGGELREPAMVLLEQAVGSEPEPEIKRNLITQIARVGGEDAIPALLSLAASDPLLEQDALDYAELLQSGERDFDSVYSLKSARDAERGTIIGASSHSD